MRNFILSIFLTGIIQSLYAQVPHMPFAFRENKGQVKDQNGQSRPDIDFTMQAPGLSLMIGDGKMHYQFSRMEGGFNEDSIRSRRVQVALDKRPSGRPKDGKLLYKTPGIIMNRLDVTLLGADMNAAIIREEEHTETYNYYDALNKKNETARVKAYGKITYKNIYPDIDWVLYIRNDELKYDFVIHPGGKVSDIKMQYGGADSIRITDNGSLRIKTPAAVITEQAPVAYEQAGSKNIPVKFLLHHNVMSLDVASYNGTLVIDPGVEWATYTGGNNNGTVADIISDQKGNMYIVGSSKNNPNIITAGAYQTTYSGITSAFLAKFTEAGVLLWGTFYSGTANSSPLPSVGPYSSGEKVTCDNYNHVYLSGYTLSTAGIATPGSFQDYYSLNPGGYFAPFLVQFNDQGELNWATYYGASATQIRFNGLGCDAQGNIYAAGFADSTTSTTNQLISPGAWQSTFGGGVSMGYYNDGLLVKFDSSGNRLWATYYGGEGNDIINAVTIDGNDNVYVTGKTNSATGISTSGTFEPVLPANFLPTGGQQNSGGFVAKFTASGQRVWGTYLNAIGYSIAVNNYGQLYVGGNVLTTTDSMLASPDAYLPTGLMYRSDFLMRYDTAIGQRIWGTYYGGEHQLSGSSGSGFVSCDTSGNVFLSGSTQSRGLPGSLNVMATPGSHQDTLNALSGVYNPPADLYIAKFDSTGARKWGTYYGGPDEEAVGISTIDHSTGAIFLAGGTRSTSAIATSGAFQEEWQANGNGMIVKFLPLDISIDSLESPLGDTMCSGAYPLSIRVSNKGKMAKTDALDISYSYTGATNGSGSFSYTPGLPVGAAQTIDIGNINLDAPGWYDFRVYLHYTQDDDDFDNDTLHFSKFVIAPPVVDIDAYFIGNTYHFSSSDTQSVNTYHWDFGDGATSTEAAPGHTYAWQDAAYTVTLTITNACGTASDSIQVQGDGTGVSGIGIARLLKLYPNPAAGMVYVAGSRGILLQSYTLVSSAGSVISQGPLKQGYGEISLQQVPAGVYILKIQTNKGVANKKLVVNQ